MNVEHLKNPQSGIIYQSLFLTLGYIVPLGAVCVMYGFMLKRLHGSAPGGASKSQESLRNKRRVTKMVVIIVAIFALCWLPIQIIVILEKLNLYSKNNFTVSIMLGANFLAFMNSCVNPIFYAFLSENFRRSFKKLLCCSSPVLKRDQYELVSVKQDGMTTATTANTNIINNVNNVNNVNNDNNKNSV